MDVGIHQITTQVGERFRLRPDPGVGDKPGRRDLLAIMGETQRFLDQYPGTHLLRPHFTDRSTSSRFARCGAGPAIVVVPDRPLGHLRTRSR